MDRLSIVNLKLWHVQKIFQTAAETEVGVHASVVGQQVTLNAERNRLIAEIDELQGGPKRVWEKL